MRERKYLCTICGATAAQRGANPTANEMGCALCGGTMVCISEMECEEEKRGKGREDDDEYPGPTVTM